MMSMFPENFDPYAQLQHCIIEVDSHSLTLEKLITAHNNLGAHVAELYEMNTRIARELREINRILSELKNEIK
jgi:hypothetical protein